MFSLPSAGEKAVKENHFLSINSNIKNEKLNAELEILMRDFDAEKQKIQDYYTEEIEKLKQEKRLKINAHKCFYLKGLGAAGRPPRYSIKKPPERPGVLLDHSIGMIFAQEISSLKGGFVALLFIGLSHQAE